MTYEEIFFSLLSKSFSETDLPEREVYYRERLLAVCYLTADKHKKILFPEEQILDLDKRSDTVKMMDYQP